MSLETGCHKKVSKIALAAYINQIENFCQRETTRRANMPQYQQGIMLEAILIAKP
jgi:hypothetical protein